MSEKSVSWDEIEKLMQELIAHQQGQLMKLGRRIIPQLTADDLLQPNDFPVLENNPHFRYEEGVLCGIQTALTAILALSTSSMRGK